MPTERVLKLLEFDKVRAAVAACAVSGCAKREILASVPATDYNETQAALSLTHEADIMQSVYSLDPVTAFDDVTDTLEKADKGSVLSMGELLRVARLLRSARIAKSTIEGAGDDVPGLKRIAEGIIYERSLERDIFDCILSDSEMSDNASPELAALRKKVRALNAKLKEKLMSYTRQNDSSKYLRDNLVTVREGRYVLPVRAECRSNVPGVVHDRSATGSTVFVEPFAIVELNNELRVAMAEEEAEVERILTELTKRVSLCADILSIAQNSCTMLDIVFSKFKYSVKNKGILPEITKNKVIKFTQARHPLIARDKVVPVSVGVGGDYSVLLITGPNTGGKTVCLKTVGLFCLMAYFGLYLPCAAATVYVFDEIYCDIGDEQSIENELSTFSSHVVSLIDITERITERSLVLLDEVGGGTDPTEGAALAEGIIAYIEKIGALSVCTTHYDELKEYAMTADRVENACMQFDEATLRPTYSLIIGMPGSSNALKIAGKLGLKREIIDVATGRLSKEKVAFERVLQAAEQIRAESEAERERYAEMNAELDKQRLELDKKSRQLDASLEKIRLTAAAETKRLVSGLVDRANEIVDEMKENLRVSDEAALIRARTLKNELADVAYSLSNDDSPVGFVPAEERDITEGAHVFVSTVGADGVVRSVNPRRKQARVTIGKITTDVPYSALGKPKSAAGESKEKRVATVRVDSSKQAMPGEREIMVIGMTVDEAVAEIEPILAALGAEGGGTVRIVHGKGTGALGKGIQRYLKTLPFVEEFRYGRYGEGDNGVTIVTLKA